MNLTTHCVSPEEIMAYLDGDFSASDAEALSSHIDQCEECSELAKQFRAVSQLLSHWEVPFAPAKLEEAVLDAATQSNAGQKLRRPGFFLRASLWTPKHWGVCCNVAHRRNLLAIFTSRGHNDVGENRAFQRAVRGSSEERCKF